VRTTHHHHARRFGAPRTTITHHHITHHHSITSPPLARNDATSGAGGEERTKTKTVREECGESGKTAYGDRGDGGNRPAHSLNRRRLVKCTAWIDAAIIHTRRKYNAVHGRRTTQRRKSLGRSRDRCCIRRTKAPGTYQTPGTSTERKHNTTTTQTQHQRGGGSGGESVCVMKMGKPVGGAPWC